MTPWPTPCLCAVTARQRLVPHARTASDEVIALREFVDALIAARVDLLQIREPDLDDARLVEVVRGAVASASGTPTVIIVNSHVELAIATGAGGVHLKEADPRSAAAIRLQAPALTVGRSLHGEVPRHDEAADYLIFGTVFPTVSKLEAASAGLESLRRTVDRVRPPLLAIGGITPARVRACLEAGAAGVAAIGAFLPQVMSPDALGPARAVRAFRDAFTR